MSITLPDPDPDPIPALENETSDTEKKQDETISLNALDLARDPAYKNEQTAIEISKSTTSINSCVDSIKGEFSSFNEQEIARLKDLIVQKENDYLTLEQKLNEVETQSRSQIEQLHLSLNTKLEQALKKMQESQKDKTSMVMKYVEAERKCIELNKTIEISHTKLNDSIKDKQRLIEKLEKSKQEIDKANIENDKKLKDLILQKREIEKLKEQLVLSDAREKAANLKLKTEIDAHLVSKAQLEQSNQEVHELKQKLTNLKDQDPPHETQSELEVSIDVPSRSVSPIEPSNKDKERIQKELSALKSQLKDMFEERTTLRDRLKCMEQERNLQEVSLGKYKETLQSQKHLNKELLNENLQLRELQETWTKDLQDKKDIEHKLILYTTELQDLQSEMSANQEKQNELLLFTSKLTEKNTQLQSENTNLNEKLEILSQDLEKTNSLLKDSNESVKKDIESLQVELNQQIKQNELISTELKEKLKQVEELSIKLSDEQDENTSLKKKHAANIKDLSRQLQSLQKKLNQQTPVLGTTSTPTIQESSEQSTLLRSSTSFNSQLNQSSNMSLSAQNSISSFHKGSRASSISSLNDKEHFMTENHDDARSIDSTFNTPLTSQHYNSEVICGGAQDDVYIVDIDKQKIIEKIVKLQKTLAKRNEKIDFMQDHVNQLTSDLKRKTKIIQGYAMGEDVGAFTSEAQDAIKREMSRKTGIMSTLYNTNKSYLQTANFINSNETNMTMELCLEINRKLQALLEDTLIKNLTFKESLETLGQEIAKLSKENRELKLNSR